MTEPVRGIVFFDVDGTLVSTGSSSSHLAARLGHREALDEAERQYADGTLTNRQVSEIDAAGWRGASTTAVERWLEDLPVLAGVELVVAWCRTHQILPVLASLAWQPVTVSLERRFGFVANGGPRVGVTGQTHDGTVAEHFDEFDKRDAGASVRAGCRRADRAVLCDRGQPVGHPALRGGPGCTGTQRDRSSTGGSVVRDRHDGPLGGRAVARDVAARSGLIRFSDWVIGTPS